MAEKIKKGFLVILIGCMLIPNIGLLVKRDFLENCEKRTLSIFPTFSFTKEWSPKLETFYRDHFTLKNLAVHLNSTLKNKIFLSSSQPQLVSHGKENWLFYNSKSDQMQASYAHTNLWTQDKLNEKISSWELWKENLENKGIQYYMAIWPNKTTIYNELMSDRMLRQIRTPLSKSDQILNGLSDTKSSIEILDLRNQFHKRKLEEQLYYKHDSHWNDLGAFYAYQSMMRHMSLTPLLLSDYLITWTETSSGDLKDLMGLCNDTSINETTPQLSLKNGKKTIEKQETKLKKTTHYINPAASSDKRILIFKDSYSIALVPYLYEHFHELYFVETDYNDKIVTAINPDIVVVAKVERRL